MPVLYYLSAALIVLSYGIYRYFTRNFSYWTIRNVPGPKPVPLFGSFKDAVLRRKGYGNVCRELYEKFPGEKVVGIYRMTSPALLIRDLDIIKGVLIKDFNTFIDRGIDYSKDGLGANIFHSDGDTWRVLRNQFTPLFTTGKLKNMLYLLIEKANQMVNHVNNIIENQTEQEVHSLCQMYSMGTIAACAFGLDLNSDQIEVLEKIDPLIFTVPITNELDMMYPGVLNYIKTDFFPRFVKEFFSDLVQNVIKQRKDTLTKRDDFIDLLLELRQQGNITSTKRHDVKEQLSVNLTDHIITAQAFVFYSAGYETSATTLAFLLHEVAKRPDIQDKLIAEIDEVLNNHNYLINYECLTEIDYVDRVFAETLRMHPVVDFLQRKALANYNIPGTNIVIQKGQIVMISTTGIHFDEKYYPNPEIFDPDRFKEESKNRQSCAYIPFGEGPRNCIGMRFAKMQSLVFILKFFSKFRVEMSKNSKNIIDIDPTRTVQRPSGGVHLIIKRR